MYHFGLDHRRVKFLVDFSDLKDVKQIFSIAMSAVISASIALALFSFRKAYEAVNLQRLNREFCHVRSEMSLDNHRLFELTRELKSRDLVSLLVRRKIEEPYCQTVAASIARDWAPHLGRLSSANRETLQQVASGGAECLYVQECEEMPRASRFEGLVERALEPVPVAVWTHDWAAVQRARDGLGDLASRAETDRLSDLGILCSLSLDHRKTTERLDYYVKRCDRCNLAQDFRRLREIAQAQQSHLRDNVARFNMKWLNSSDVFSIDATCQREKSSATSSLFSTEGQAGADLGYVARPIGRPISRRDTLARASRITESGSAR